MNKESKKLTWAVGLVAGLGVLSIAYAALSSTLNIKGEGASVNVGYVHFENSSAVAGIGSGNPDYITGDNSNIEDRATDGDTSTGIIGSAYFEKNWAKALAVPGTLNVGTSDNGKTNDTVTVSGTQLNDYGSFVIYKLDIINDSANGMKLAEAPKVKISTTDDKSGTNPKEYTGSDIEAKVYSNYSENNFATGGCSTEVAAFSGTDYPSSPSNNYLTAGGTTSWYLKVRFKNYSDVANKTAGTTWFKFETSPVWEAVM